MSATNRGAIRRTQDFYATPLSSFTPLLKHLRTEFTYWEPCCGDGRLVSKLKEAGFVVDGNDLNAGYDYLKDFTRRDFIITNPPYSLAFEFLKHAVENSQHVLLLLRLNFLASIKRAEWFKAHEPDALYILSKRPSFTGWGTDACDYAWMYFKGIFGAEPFMKGIHHI